MTTEDVKELTTQTLCWKLRRSDDPLQCAAADRIESLKRALDAVTKEKEELKAHLYPRREQER